MTVAELIAKLQTMPQDMEVVTEYTAHGPDGSMDLYKDIVAVTEFESKVVIGDW